VTGVTGITAAEAHAKWSEMRPKIPKSWKVVKQSQSNRADILEKLSDPLTTED